MKTFIRKSDGHWMAVIGNKYDPAIIEVTLPVLMGDEVFISHFQQWYPTRFKQIKSDLELIAVDVICIES